MTNKPTGEAAGLQRYRGRGANYPGSRMIEADDGPWYLAADVDALLAAERAAHAAALAAKDDRIYTLDRTIENQYAEIARLTERHREYVHKSEALNLRLAAEDDEDRAKALAAKDAALKIAAERLYDCRAEVEMRNTALDQRDAELAQLHADIEAQRRPCDRDGGGA